MTRSAPTRRTGKRRTPPKPVRQAEPDRTDWEAKRHQLYLRAHGRCEGGVTPECLAAKRALDTLGMEAHHRKLRSQGGAHGLVNLLGLCPYCHRWAHANPEKARLRGLICPRFHDPATWALTLPDGRIVQLDREGGYVDVMPAPAGATA